MKMQKNKIIAYKPAHSTIITLQIQCGKSNISIINTVNYKAPRDC